MQAFSNLESKINTIYPNYIKKLGLFIYKTDIRAWKIDKLSLKTFDIIIAIFQV